MRMAFDPVSSAGEVSGVNWMRLKVAPSMCAVARARSVFALPGGPFQKDVPACQERPRAEARCIALSDDDLRDLDFRLLAQFAEALVAPQHQKPQSPPPSPAHWLPAKLSAAISEAFPADSRPRLIPLTMRATDVNPDAKVVGQEAPGRDREVPRRLRPEATERGGIGGATAVGHRPPFASSSTVSTGFVLAGHDDAMPEDVGRRHGARTSSIVAVVRPFRRAFAFVAFTRWIMARELTPARRRGAHAFDGRLRDDVAPDGLRRLRCARAPAGPCPGHDTEQWANSPSMSGAMPL